MCRWILFACGIFSRNLYLALMGQLEKQSWMEWHSLGALPRVTQEAGLCLPWQSQQGAPRVCEMHKGAGWKAFFIPERNGPTCPERHAGLGGLEGECGDVWCGHRLRPPGSLGSEAARWPFGV